MTETAVDGESVGCKESLRTQTTPIPIPDDPQVDAVIRASGHTRADVYLFLAELNKIGWTVKPIVPTFALEGTRQSCA